MHFSEVISRGCLQTGAKHGNQDVTYVEYMCSGIEKRLVIGGEELYLNHIKFVKENHAEKIRKIFDEKMANIDAPVPCPTRHKLTTLTVPIWVHVSLMENARGIANQIQNLLQVQFSSSILVNSLLTNEVHFQC